MTRGPRRYSELITGAKLLIAVTLTHLLIDLIHHFSSGGPFLSVLKSALSETLVLGIATTVSVYFFVFRPLLSAREQRRDAEALQTAIRRAEEEKAKSESIIAAIGDGISIQDTDFKILYQNDIQKNLVGDHTGEYCYQAYEKRDAVCDGCAIALSFHDGKIHTVERSAPTDHGTIYAEITTSVVRDSTGKIVAGIEIARDITRRKQADAALKKREQQLGESQRIAHIGSWERDLATGRAEWSDEMYRIFGYDSHTTVPGYQAILDRVHPEDRDAFSKAAKGSLSEGKPYTLDYRIIRPDGTEAVIHELAEVVSYASDKPVLLQGTAQDITEHKRMEDALRKQWRLAEVAIQNSAVATFVLNADHHIVAWNKACEVLTGLSAASMIGTDDQWHPFYDHKRPTLADVVIDGNFNELPSLYRNHSPSELGTSALHAEDWYPALNGKERYIIFDASPFLDHDGKPLLVIETLQDITERKQAEDKILRLNRVYSMLSAINKTIVRTRDRDLLFESACRIAVEQGRFRMAWVGLADPATKRVSPAVFSGIEEGYLEEAGRIARGMSADSAPVQSVLRTGVHVVINDVESDLRVRPLREAALRRGYRSVGYFPLQVNSTVIGTMIFYSAELNFFDDSEIRLLDELAADISFALEFIDKDLQHKLAEEQIVQSKQDWEDTFESITDMVTIHDKDYNIVRANKAAEKILHLPILSPKGAKCFEHYHGTECPPQGCPSCQSLVSGKPSSFELFEPHLNRFIEIRAIPRLDRNNQLVGLIHVVRDITEHRKLEEQLLQAQKMEAVGQLAGGVAHDFNNILTAILGDAYLLEMKLGAGSPFRQYVDDIRTSAERAANLTQSLLAFSRKQILNPKPVDLNSVIRKLHKLTARLIGEDIDYKTFLSGSDLTVMADSGQFEQVMLNLITNARDAMPGGGKLSITTKPALIDDDYIASHGFGTPGKYALTSVSDSGTGMDERTKDKIFEPFFTTKEVGKGTGLGLAIVYGIVKQHNGFILCESVPRKGTAFHIYLPLVDSLVDDRKKAEIAPRHGTECLLLAEDDEKVRDTMITVLEEFGYRVVVAVDGEDAVRKYQEYRDDIRLLVMDVIMPKKNGKLAYEEIKKMNPDIKILFVSGYPNDIIHAKGVLDSNLNFLAKPSSPITLVTKIRELLDS